MSRRITIRKPEDPIRCTIELPRSKSIANRALILASLAGDLSCVHDLSDADDTRTLHQLLRDKPRVMHCGAGGTTFRFLLAWACVQEGEEHVLTGDARLLERPHDDLINALQSLGASIERTSEGYLVKGMRLSGGSIALDSPMSSQFISALLLIAPRMQNGLELQWTGRRLSEPYVRMTVKCLQHFGVTVHKGGDAIHVRPSLLTANTLSVPRDWSAAAFWFEIAALADDADIVLPGLTNDGYQGDSWIEIFMSEMVGTQEEGTGLRITSRYAARRADDPILSSSTDLVGTPDLFQPLAFTFAALGILKHFKGLDNLSLKETDRLAAVAAALAQFDIRTEWRGEWWAVPPSGITLDPSAPLVFDPHGDHRMAMSLAPLALRLGPITITAAEVVNKSYPTFWEDLRKAGFGIELS